MKRFISWVVLALSLFVTGKIIQFIVYIGLEIASRLYDSSKGIFWLIIFGGGSFGLGIAYFFSFAAATYVIKISEKVYPSKNGTRYKVGAVIMGLLFTLDFISCFIVDLSGIGFTRQIILDIFAVFFSILLFIIGRVKDED